MLDVVGDRGGGFVGVSVGTLICGLAGTAQELAVRFRVRLFVEL